MQNVTLIGHSRNGQGIFWLTPVVEELGAKVNGLFAFAPAYTQPGFDAYPDIPTSIIVPSQDNDVIQMDGQRIFDLFYDMERETDVRLVYFFGGNHAAFNEALIHQDNRLRNIEPEKTIPIMDPALQRSIYTAYIFDFLKAVNNGGSLNGLPHELDGSFYGERALVTFLGGGRQVLPADFQAVSRATVSNVVGSYMMNENTAGYMNFPGTPLNLPLIQISWENEGAAAVLPLESIDASGYRALVIDLAQDSTSPLNETQDQSMTVILTDGAGKTSRVELPRGTAALSWQTGEIRDILTWQGELFGREYSDFTPISSVVLPLDDFPGVDLQDLRSITLKFDRQTGCIVVRGASLVW
jgi:hypothetical protein